MVRRARRSGVRFIESDGDRTLTFFKRRSGLFKAVADLSTLTGARVAIVLESESGKFSSFGTPAADPIVDAFLAGNASMAPYANMTITELQNELFQLEKDMAVEEKRKKCSITLANELPERSRTGKLVFGKEEDLDEDDIREKYHGLTRVQQEIKNRLLPVVHHGKQQQAGGMRDPLLLQPSWWRRSLPSKMAPPRALPWTPIQPSLKFSELSFPTPIRSQSSIPNPMMLPSHEFPPRSLAPSMVPLQAQNMPVPNEAIPSKCRIWGVDISINNSSSLFPSPMSSSSPPLPPSLHIPQFNESSHPLSPPQHFSPPLSLNSQLPFKDPNNNSVEIPKKYPSSGLTSTPPNKPYYAILDGLNLELGNTDENGGSLQGDGWIDGMLSESSSIGGKSGAGAGNNLGGMNLPWN
ncbi:hypothetical protein EJB05_16378, partial [Eragrostis curvula]